MRRILIGLACAALILPLGAGAQSRTETLADIRQQMSVLYVEIQKLKRELSTTGATGQAAVGGSVIDRVAAIEGELQRLTAKTEDLELRIDRIVTDGTRRLGDLEFRLVELEGGDVSKLGETSTLGGGALPQSEGTITPPAPEQGGDLDETGMAVSEKADFDAAQAAFDAGQYAEAARLFAEFRQTYPGGPLTARAGLKRGEALEQAGETTDAARAYLDTFSADPDGPEAPDALFNLGAALGKLNQTDEACQTLGEVENRFPQSPAVTKARSAMQNLGCP